MPKMVSPIAATMLAASRAGRPVTPAQAMLQGLPGFAADFLTDSLAVYDPATPANGFLGSLNTSLLAAVLTFSRASQAWGFGPSGSLDVFASGVPRRVYDSTALTPLGYLPEPTFTCAIRNNTMQGAAVGNPGTVPTNWSATGSVNGITREVSAVSASDGIEYIGFRFSGSASSLTHFYINLEALTGVPALSGQSWVASLFCRLASGALPATAIVFALSGRDSGGGVVGAEYVQTTIAPTSAALKTQRPELKRTLNQATTAYLLPYLDVTIQNGETVNFELWIGLPNAGQGAFVTSPVKTYGTAQARLADRLYLDTSKLPANNNKWSILAEFLNPQQTGVAWSLANGASPNFSDTAYGSSTPGNNQIGAIVRSGNVDQAVISQAGGALGGVTRQVIRLAQDNVAVSVNGSTVQTDTAATYPAGGGANMADIGSLFGNAQLGQPIRRIMFLPNRLFSDGELQSRSAL